MAAPTKIIKLLLTGLGPCGTLVDNPASIATRQLKDLVLTSAPPVWSGASADDVPVLSTTSLELPQAKIKVEIAYQETQNAYRQFNEVLTAAHETGKYDVMVHVAGSKGDKMVRIQRGSNRLGYSRKDFDSERKLAPKVEGGFGLEGDVDRWETTLDVPALVEYLSGSLGFKNVREDNDAGNYTGGYIYGKSLQLAEKQAKASGKKAVPAVLLYLPPMNDWEKQTNGLHFSESDYVELLRAVCWNVAQQVASEV